ncbi:MAG: hypothetical protein KDC73_09540 [Ignavibacteriae bacterium]|nr:hypothetical protein [Ignavibacteriota bacterium]MCB9242047.1 hypothetical protein [Ignavibacteriales bacterium]
MKKIYLTLIIAIIAGITLTGGDCEDSGTSGGTQNDPNVMVFSNLVVQEVDPNNGSFGGASPSALNLLLGLVDSSASTNKDVALVSDGLNPNGSGFDFFWRSGDQSLDNIAQGKKTLFGQFIEWEDITEAQWDTLSRIWKSTGNADTLTALDFANQTTKYPGSEYFNYPLTSHRVYAFYLEGKYTSGITSKPVYGMLYLKSTSDAGGLFPFRVTVDVKINTAGINQFLQTVPIQ